MDNDYAPYSFQSDDGKLQGILIDQWQAWEKKTGIKVEIHAMDWGEALRRMRAGEFDVIDSIVETAERRDSFDFTQAYTTIEASIYFRHDISGITDLASLKGFPVGVKTGDQHIDKLKANGVTTVIPFQSNDAIVEAAKQHKINVFVADAPSALYLLNKMGIEADFRHSAPIFRDELRRAVRKGDAALLRTVSEGFAAIEPGELKQIDEKWFGRTINRYGRYLTYAGYAAAVAILLIAGLVGWNRTLRKRILQRTAALGESEQRFRQIAENIREVFWLSTADLSNALYISPAFESVWGRSRESLYQDLRSFFAAIHPEDRSRVITTMERDREQGFEVEYRVVRPDGSIRWIWDRGFPIKDESGRFYRVAGIAEDITERKQAEALLYAKEQEFRAIVENAPDQIIRYDREFRRTYVNPAVAEAYGLPAEALIGKPLGSVIQDAGLDIKEDDVAQVRQRIADVFNTGKSYEYELNWPLLMGRRYFSVRLFPELDLNGSVISVLGISQDITESKRDEEELKKEKEILEKIVDNIPLMIAFVGDQGRVKLVNPEWERTIGWTLKELQEQNVDIFAEAYPDLPYRQEVLDFVAAATGEWVDLKIKVRDGRVIDAACAVVHLSDGTKIAIAQDITERKRAEDALRRSEDRIRLIIDTIPTMAWTVRPDGVVDFVNQRWLDYTGLSLEARIEDTNRSVHPEDLPGVMEKWLVKMAAEEPSEGEMRMRRADGEYRWFLVRTAPLRDEQGNLVKWYGVSTDIEDLKRAEEALKESQRRLEEAQRIAHVGHWERDLETRRITWSDEIYRILGLPLEERDSPRTEWLDVVHPEDRPRLSVAIEEMLRGIRRLDMEFRIVRPNGEVRFLHSQGDVIRDERGRPVRMFGTAQDITERKRAEEQLKATTEQLRALSASLQSAREEEGIRIAREIHDELGSALTSLRWDLQAIEGIFSESGNRSQVPALQKKIAAMLGLTDTTINTVRRIASELRPSVLDDLGLVVAIEWQAQQFQDRTGIVVHCDFPLGDVDCGLSALRAVFGAALLAIFHARGIETASHDVIAHARQVFDAAAANQHDRVLLQVVSFAADVADHLETVGEPHFGHFTQRRVRLLRSRRVDARADPAALRGTGQRRHLALGAWRAAGFSHELVDRRHKLFSPIRF